MGVWLARRKTDGQHYALKEMQRSRVDEGALLKSVWEERAALRAVTNAREQDDSAVSQALVGSVTSYTTSCAVCLVMDLVEGAPLHEHVRQLGRLPEASARWYVAEISDALGWLHGSGWLYRDLKLSNVMISVPLGRVRLVDFGFAKRASRASSVVGTLFTMAPEVIKCVDHSGQAVQGATYGCAADWWSLGVLLFEMLTGASPFGYHDDVLLEGQQLAQKHQHAASQGLPWPTDGDIAVSSDARYITDAFLRMDDSLRLGAHGTEEVRAQRWLLPVQWDTLADPQAPGPAFDQSLGWTVERATKARQRPKRGRVVGLAACLDPDPFEGF